MGTVYFFVKKLKKGNKGIEPLIFDFKTNVLPIKLITRETVIPLWSKTMKIV